MVDRSSLTDEVRLADLTFEGALDRLVVYTAMEDGQLALNCERVVVAEIEALRFFCALLMACGDREDLVDEVSICRTVLGIEVERAERSQARAEKAEASLVELAGALNVVANASARSETMFGGRMSEVTRVFENITRVSRTAFRRVSDVHSRLLEGVSGEGGISQSQPVVSAVQLPASPSAQHSDGGED
ncbi:hypothetical protein LJR164_001589 [Phenylobacterium sp. LjRoot164]|uniref:hypothetical protein n=1 Tax=unclassified Phenylobacterium TaxID=2640670 RepID=UPI003ED0E638